MSEIIDHVKRVVAKQLEKEESEITENSSFVGDLGADSLDEAELIIAFETEFDCEISNTTAASIKTAKDAIELLSEAKQTPAP